MLKPSVGDATVQNMVYFRAVNGNITAENCDNKICQRDQGIVRQNRF